MTSSYRGILWDDLRHGQTFWSSGRTITEHDVSAFSALSGDFNPLHVDDEEGKCSVFGRRIPHGPLGMLFAIGGYDRIGLLEGVVVALLDMNWRFRAPMHIGDTLRTKVTVAALEESKKPDLGKLTMHLQMYNQREEVVQEGEHRFLIRRRTDDEAGP
ncbi:dehydratase [Actinomadura darangshiensis]|uniref:Dehydratase n=1 Tax=Actinomadura darangshiensis TaxID=705336 RepID=A0A4R5C064_9ACTN|nr:MaoC/PaaZ C-terminal domain-containing protein [Actinomadura darangshiensis]TDD92931.1 dehydratase [Actinomadura darangshiensis]